MVLESTVVCVDNSDYMRNGDFVPSRLLAQQDAVNLICHSKTRSNPENNVALITFAGNAEVLVTLTSDVGKLLAKLHQIRPKGVINFGAAIRIAHLVLKHRQGKNHRMRVVAFVGSPIVEDEKELVKLGKKLRKEKVNVDIVNFGEEGINTEKLTVFINTINASDGNGSHLVTVQPGPLLSDALISSPVIVGEDGAGAVPGGYEFGVDPNEDPELALALRVSMEEQRARQEEEARKATAASVAEMAASRGTEETEEEKMLRQALEFSMQPMDQESSGMFDSNQDLSAMTEEEQLQYALRLSQQTESGGTPMDLDENKEEKTVANAEEEVDFSEVMNDPAFLQSVLQNLPGVDPESDAIKDAMGQLLKQDKEKKDPKKEDKK